MKNLKVILLISFSLFISSYVNAQAIPKTKRFKLGFDYGVGSQKSIFFKDKDYDYTSQIFNIELNYLIKKGILNYELVIGPSYNEAKHTLLNKYFVKPSETDYLIKRDAYTKEKNIKNYILNIGIIVRKNIGKKFSIYLLGSIGPMYNDTTTERLAKGLAFLDNISLGATYRINDIISFDIRPSLKHISNAQLQKPNSGYNFTNIQSGINIKL